MKSATVTAAETAGRLTVNGYSNFAGLRLKAATDNANNVYVGFDSSLTAATGYPLDAGQELVLYATEAPDTSYVYIIGGAASQKVSYLTAGTVLGAGFDFSDHVTSSALISIL